MIVCLHSTWYKGLRLEMPDLYERVYTFAINIASYWSGNETRSLQRSPIPPSWTGGVLPRQWNFGRCTLYSLPNATDV